MTQLDPALPRERAAAPGVKVIVWRPTCRNL
jgi:hypothetical protein